MRVKPRLWNLFSRNTANLVHSSKSFYCLSPGLTREGPLNAEVAHQAQLIPKLVFLQRARPHPSRMSTIIDILAMSAEGPLQPPGLAQVLCQLPRGEGRASGLLQEGTKTPALSLSHSAQQHCPFNAAAGSISLEPPRNIFSVHGLKKGVGPLDSSTGMWVFTAPWCSETPTKNPRFPRPAILTSQ